MNATMRPSGDRAGADCGIREIGELRIPDSTRIAVEGR